MVETIREIAGKDAEPTAGIIDVQSVKSTLIVKRTFELEKKPFKKMLYTTKIAPVTS